MRAAAPSLEQLSALFAAHGDPDPEYLRDHYERFVQTRDLLCRGWDPAGGMRLLDIGAHWLHQSLLFGLSGFAVTALDVPATLDDPKLRSLAAEHAIRLLPNADLEQVPALQQTEDDAFDVIVLAEVIEHLTFNPVALWTQIHRVLRRGGRIVITTPNYYALRSRLRQAARTARLLGGGLAVEQIVSVRTHGPHWKEYSRRELAHYFAALSPDFAIVRVAYMEKRRAHLPRRTGMGILLAFERAFPPARPELYLEIELRSKDRGILPRPHW